MDFCEVLKNSFEKIDNMLDDTQINEFKGIKYDELWQCHFGFGL